MANGKNFGDNLIAQLKKTAVNLEEFQVQLALGKAEAKDKIVELKKKFDETVHSAKQKLNEGKNKFNDVRAEFEELLIQLALGKAETKDAFEEQKKKISSALAKFIKRLETMEAEVGVKLKSDIEKFKIEMEVVRVKYALGKMDATDAFEKEKRKLMTAIAKMKAKFEPKKKPSST